jgi:large subunit ribosomal protein L3
MIGAIGKKLGMTQIFGSTGEIIPVTVVEIPPNTVIQKKTIEKDGYNACVIGAGVKKKPNRPYSGIFKVIGIKPTQKLQEIRDPPTDWEPGKEITVSIFSDTSKVDVTGYSKGRGFAGVMKRYGWHGGPGGHGSKFHRRPGAIGTSKTPGRVLKGHKLPGRMGNSKTTIKNLEIVKRDEARNLLFLKGSIPGARNSWILIRSKV